MDKYCRKCGDYLIVTYHFAYYKSSNRTKIYHRSAKCPNKKWWNTHDSGYTMHGHGDTSWKIEYEEPNIWKLDTI